MKGQTQQLVSDIIFKRMVETLHNAARITLAVWIPADPGIRPDEEDTAHGRDGEKAEGGSVVGAVAGDEPASLH